MNLDYLSSGQRLYQSAAKPVVSVVDGDPDFLWMDAQLTLVDKHTAEITFAKSLDSFPLMDAMTPVTARERVFA